MKRWQFELCSKTALQRSQRQGGVLFCASAINQNASSCTIFQTSCLPHADPISVTFFTLAIPFACTHIIADLPTTGACVARCSLRTAITNITCHVWKTPSWLIIMMGAPIALAIAPARTCLITDHPTIWACITRAPLGTTITCVTVFMGKTPTGLQFGRRYFAAAIPFSCAHIIADLPTKRACVARCSLRTAIPNIA